MEIGKNLWENESENRIFKRKGLELTTLAIIGGGIAGRSLIYALAKEQKSFSRILLFDADSFAQSCSLRSTALVAARGVTTGHSELGDLLVRAFATFSEHVTEEAPAGVFAISQFTAALTKLDQFQGRYPDGEFIQSTEHFLLTEPTYMAFEPAYMIDPELYLNWLSLHGHPFEQIEDFVVEVSNTPSKMIRTQKGMSYEVDEVIFAGGSHHRFWGEAAPKSQPVQGSYLEFEEVNLGAESFSLTLEGDNLIYHAHAQRLLIGSTTDSTHHYLGVEAELALIYDRLCQRLETPLPPLSEAQVRIGLREKGAKRMPYVKRTDAGWWIGGFYKNGYSLGLQLAQELIRQLP